MNPLRLLHSDRMRVVGPPYRPVATPDAHQEFIEKHGPVDRSVTDFFPDQFTGDQPDRRHAYLWNKAEMLKAKGGRPAPEARVGVVVVGGGIAGLAMTDLLRDKNPVLLEQSPRFGGTAKGESWEGIEYALGAAYFVKPEPGEPLHGYLDGLGVLSRAVYHDGGASAVLGGKLYADIFNGELDLLRAEEYRKIREHLQAIHDGHNGLKIPEIPAETEVDKRHAHELDGLSLLDYLTHLNGGPLPPNLHTAIEHYCWSAFGASMNEISAAAGLNFLASEFGDIGVLPAGNATIAELILKRILNDVPESNLRADVLVIDVEVVEDGVLVTYVDAEDKIHCVHAETVVMSCPKFVAARVIKDIEPSRIEDVRQKMRYRSYVVANVMIDQRNPHSDYDVIFLGDGKTSVDDIQGDSLRKMVTDVVMANFANPGHDKTVLTLYFPLPFDAGMAKMLDPDSFNKIVSELMSKVVNEIVPSLGFDADKIAGFRVTRWGHALPVALQGMIQSGLITRLQAPFKDRIFFAEMGNNALPSVESALESALLYAPQVRQKISAAG